MSQFNCSTRSRINTDHCDGRGDVSYRYWNEVQHTSFVLILCTQQVRSEHIEIVVPVVMEMLRRVHEKFTLHYNLILPPIGRKHAIAPHAGVSFVNEKESLFISNACRTLQSLYELNCFFYVQDTGISVRKRVIKILRDICLEQPTFSKITEMCVRMIRRVNDEEGIKVWINCIFVSSHFYLFWDVTSILWLLLFYLFLF